MGNADPAVPTPQRLLDVGYPIGDLFVLVTLVRLLVPGIVRGTSVVLLIIATVSGLASDAAYQVMVHAANHHVSDAVGIGWLVGSIAWGAAALHQSMTELTEPAGRREQTASPARITMLMLTSLIPPIYLLIRSVERRDGPTGVVAVLCGVRGAYRGVVRRAVHPWRGNRVRGDQRWRRDLAGQRRLR